MITAEIFVGAGGLALGAADAGGKSLFAIDNNDSCYSTLELNKKRGLEPFRDWHIRQGDVRSMDYSPFLHNVDVLLGGPPCQPFSIGGLNRADSDARDMFPEAVRALRELAPRAFLFENVAGLARSRFKEYFEYVLLQLRFPAVIKGPQEHVASHRARLHAEEASSDSKGLSYDVCWKQLNAADYGVPQRRNRIFIVGFRSDIDACWGFPQSTHSLDALLWAKHRSMTYVDNHKLDVGEFSIEPDELRLADRLIKSPKPLAWRTVRDAISDLNGCFDPNLDHCFIPGARVYRGHTGSMLDLPSKTIKAGVHGVPGGENMIRNRDGSVRYFTVRECARLQTFPDAMVFSGTWGQKVRQIGNAVPPVLAQLLVGSVFDALRGNRDRASPAGAQRAVLA